MNAIGRIKYTNSKSDIFAFVSVINSFDGTKGVDAYFLKRDFFEIESYFNLNPLLLLELQLKNGKYRAKCLQPLTEATNDDILSCISLFNNQFLIEALKVLADRKINIPVTVLKDLFDFLGTCKAYIFPLTDTWRIIKYVNNENASKQFYDLLDEIFFKSNWYHDSYAPMDWFFQEGLDEFFVKRAKLEGNPILSEIFREYDLRKEFEKAKDLIEFMPQKSLLFDDLRKFYYAINYLDEPIQFIKKDLGYQQRPEKALSVLIERSYFTKTSSYVKIANFILSEIFSKECKYIYKDLRVLFDKEIDIEISIRFKFITVLLELSSKSGEKELLVIFPQILSRYPEYRFEILRVVLIDLGFMNKEILESIPEEMVDEQLVHWLTRYIPKFYELCPEFFLKIVHKTKLHLYKASDPKIMNSFVKVVEKLLSTKESSLKEEIYDYFMTNLLETKSNNERLEVMYGFVFANYEILHSIHDYINSDLMGSGHYFVVALNGLLENGTIAQDDDGVEIRVLLSMLGIHSLTHAEILNANFFRIIEKMSIKTEFALIQFIASITYLNQDLREKLLSFIKEFDPHAFESIVIKQMLTSDNPQSMAISNLNQAFLAAYSLVTKIENRDLRDYFTFNRLVKGCVGRRSYTYPEKKIVEGREELVVNDIGHLYSTDVNYCEGRYWKNENYYIKPQNLRKTVQLYYCRGLVCIEPNNKAVMTSHYLYYSLAEIAESLGIQFSDIINATIGGWLNRLNEILDLLYCGTCSSLLIPVSFLPDNLGHYGTPLFKCPKGDCASFNIPIRITHCRGCGKVLDSRTNVKCRNDWLICDNCRSCCPDHSGGQYIPHYRKPDDGALPF
jgi:hypothetical protein